MHSARAREQIEKSSRSDMRLSFEQTAVSSARGAISFNPQPVMTGPLLLRCQYAFKAAAAMALAGQAADVFPVLRSVLEYAGYCLLIFETPSLEGVYILRHADGAAMKEQRDAFQIRAIKGTVSRHCSTALTTLFEDLYQRTIDFGAHPNPNAVFSTTSLDETKG